MESYALQSNPEDISLKRYKALTVNFIDFLIFLSDKFTLFPPIHFTVVTKEYLALIFKINNFTCPEKSHIHLALLHLYLMKDLLNFKQIPPNSLILSYDTTPVLASLNVIPQSPPQDLLYHFDSSLTDF